MTYLSFYMWKAGVGNVDISVYEEAEDALNRTVERAERTGVWRLPDVHTPSMERMLAAYDAQIATVSARNYMEAVARLDRLLFAQNTAVAPENIENKTVQCRRVHQCVYSVSFMR
ncbi:MULTISPECIES: hypothetical protein [Paraburkholderia]|uniref:hypothetical protein n=1 Tax=Paraburkholderia TaxID=1822464 RepID=UPI00321812EF